MINIENGLESQGNQPELLFDEKKMNFQILTRLRSKTVAIHFSEKMIQILA